MWNSVPVTMRRKGQRRGRDRDRASGAASEAGCQKRGAVCFQIRRRAGETRALINELGTRYTKEVEHYKSFQPGVSCPVCHRPVTVETLGEVQAELKSSLLPSSPKGASAKPSWMSFRRWTPKARKCLGSSRRTTFKAEDEIRALTSQNGENENEDSQLTQLRTEIQNLTATLEYGNLTPVEYDRLRVVRKNSVSAKANFPRCKALRTSPARTMPLRSRRRRIRLP